MIWEVPEFQGTPGGGGGYTNRDFLKPAVIKTNKGYIYFERERETALLEELQNFFQKYNVQWRLTYPEIFVPMPNRPDR